LVSRKIDLKAMAKPKSGGVPKLTHTVTPSPHAPIKGASTKTDMGAMSTSEYRGHVGRGKRQLKK
jgi:hypothetical protein